MLNKSFQSKLSKEYQNHQEMRHQLIADSNNALKNSKQAIFSLHRQDTKTARLQLDAVKKAFQFLQKGIIKKQPELKLQGAYLAALEEYVEAELFYQAITQGKIDVIKGLEIGVEQYLGGLADVSGELTRQAVIKATERDFKTVEQFYKIAEEINGSLLQFDLVGHLRQKYDDSKRNVKRLESIRYDISMRDQKL